MCAVEAGRGMRRGAMRKKQGMNTYVMPTTEEPRSDEPLLVMVASDDPSRLEHARAVATFVPDVRITEALSSITVVRLVTSLYEHPVGCPDIVLLDDAMLGAREAAAWLRDACPGVRIIGFGGDDPIEALATVLREQVAAIELAER